MRLLRLLAVVLAACTVLPAQGAGVRAGVGRRERGFGDILSKGVSMATSGMNAMKNAHTVAQKECAFERGSRWAERERVGAAAAEQRGCWCNGRCRAPPSSAPQPVRVPAHRCNARLTPFPARWLRRRSRAACMGCMFVWGKVHAASDSSSGPADVKKSLEEVCSAMPDVFFDAVSARGAVGGEGRA